MQVLILGANGFIGSHLVEAILEKKDWQIKAIDLADDKLRKYNANSNFHLKLGDITKEEKWIEDAIQQADVILPLVAIATPALYVRDPLRVFELDFEVNLKIVRQCVHYQKRIIFPSTSEVYGMCADPAFDEENSFLVTGPIHKERWIYATSKQLLDRLIYAYGKHHGLSYTLFRPFNWYGPQLDNIDNPKPGASRVLTQFIGNIMRGESINLVNGGEQKRCFTYISDGIEALLTIIENKNSCAENQIFNIGNPSENFSIRTLAESLIDLVKKYFPHFEKNASSIQLKDITAQHYYGDGYQDVSLRVPAIARAQQMLGWNPKVDLQSGLKETLAFYMG